MEVLRGGRAGLHSMLRPYVLVTEADFYDPRLLVDIHAPLVLPSRWILRELSKGHSPVAVGVIIPQEDIEAREKYQLVRARVLHGTPDETPQMRSYYLKHLEEIRALN